MNEGHITYLSSPAWRGYLEADLLPWALGDVELGPCVLEVGPGPGLTTDLVRTRVERLVAVEVDPVLAGALAGRLTGSNVEVVAADATKSGLPSDDFDTALCFTMLHHVPTPALQDQLFAELCRMLRPGGRLVGTDSIDTPDLRAFHADDVFVPVDPGTLESRLTIAGFGEVEIDVKTGGPRPGPRLCFRATKPA